MISFEGKYAKSALVMADGPVDAETQSQIVQLTNHPAFTEDIRFMPDYHAGKGAVIGFTMPLPSTGFVVPNVVGVDIGCGMIFVRWAQPELACIKLKRMQGRIDALIRGFIPTNTDVQTNYDHIFSMERIFPWDDVSKANHSFCRAYNETYGFNMQPTIYTYKWFQDKCEQVGMNAERAVASVGTLGGGK